MKIYEEEILILDADPSLLWNSTKVNFKVMLPDTIILISCPGESGIFINISYSYLEA